MKDKLRLKTQPEKIGGEPDLEAQLSRQNAIGEIAQLAIECQEINPFLKQVSSLVAHTIDIPYCAILEQNIAQQVLQLVAGVGWQIRDMSTIKIPLNHRYQLTQTLKTGQTLMVENFSSHKDFSASAFLESHHVVSGISVIIPTPKESYGILSVHSRERRKYTQQEKSFLEIIAQVVGKTIARLETSRKTELLTLNDQPRDITEAQWDRFFGLNLEIFCIAGFDGYFKQFNPAFERILGYSAAELRAKPFIEFVHSQDQEGTLIKLQNLTQGEKVYHFENRYRCRDGSYRWLAWTSVPYLEEEIIYAVARDVTEQKKIETALRRSEEKFRLLFEQSPTAMALADLEGHLVYVNQALCQLLGYTEEELLNKSCRDVTHPEDKEKEQRLIQKLLSGDINSFRLEKRYLRKDKQIIHALLQLTVIRDLEGKPLNFLGQTINISEQKEKTLALQESEERLGRIISTISDGLLVVDQQGTVCFVNEAAVELFGRSELRLMNHRLGLPIGNHQPTEIFIQQPNGQLIIAQMRVADITWRRESCYLVSLRDITENYQAQEALAKSEERLEGILTSIQDVVWSLDPNFSQLKYINAAAQIVLGFSLEELYETPNLLLTIVYPDDQELVKHHRYILMEIGHTEFQYRIVRKDGTIRWLYSRMRGVYNEEGNIIRVDGIESDITEQKRAQEQLQYNATHDPLTNLPNRILFIDRLEHAIDRKQRHPEFNFAVLFLDLDEFKVINDSLGHAIGDQLLQEISHRLQKGLRNDDTLARLGGDEFTILLEDIEDIKDAIKIAKRIHVDLTRPFVLEEQDIFINTSIGIALSGSGYKEAAEILRDADTAMYRAKADGKACYAIFDHKMHEKAVRRLQLETDLRIAIKKQEFKLYYQPIICLETGKITAFEALIRWLHPHKKLISPGHFIPIAEETGLIITMGEWILKEACQQLKQWHQQFPNYSHLKVGVNLSSKQLKYSNLISTIDKVLQETQLEGKSLKLEIT